MKIPVHAEKKTLVRRTPPDRSQCILYIARWFSAELTAWMGVRFYL
ncbi:MAG: hypothetical protein WBE76_30925 [Terracidiphilus sp.]